METLLGFKNKEIATLNSVQATKDAELREKGGRCPYSVPRFRKLLELKALCGASSATRLKKVCVFSSILPLSSERNRFQKFLL